MHNIYINIYIYILYIYILKNHGKNGVKKIFKSLKKSKLKIQMDQNRPKYLASKHYKNILNHSWYNQRFQYKPPINENEIKSKSCENHKRNMIWFIPPFSQKVSNYVVKYFLLLIQKPFPNNHKYHKIFNQNNVKISYGCTANIKSIINIHNK